MDFNFEIHIYTLTKCLHIFVTAQTLFLHSKKLNMESKQEIIRTVQKDKQKWYAILVVAGIVPIVCLCGLTLSEVIRAAQIRNDALHAQDESYTFVAIDTALQIIEFEGGFSHGYVRHEGRDHWDNVVYRRQLTDESIEKLDFSEFQSERPELQSKQNLKNYLKDHREKVDILEVSVTENIIFFAELVENMIKVAEKLIRLPEKGEDLWRKVAAAGLMLRASQSTDTALSLIRNFGFYCDYREELTWFHRAQGAEEALLHQAFIVYPPLGHNYTVRYLETQLYKNLQESKKLLLSDQFEVICRNMPEEERHAFGFPWFQQALDSFFVMTTIRNDLMSVVIMDLDQVVHEAENEMMKLIVVFIITATISIIIITSIIRQILIMVNNLVRIATREKIVTYNLDVDRRRSDFLLDKMVPAAVAEQLKAGREVLPQYFDSATICYVDVVDFMILTTQLQVFQTIKLLTGLSRLVDSTIQVCNVHKMEDIVNDTFCAVSGVPQNIETHAVEMANFAIELMKKVGNFKMDDVPNVKVQIRAGLHTGHCAAGVIGHKVPRYSVFGKSVKMADRMCRTSPAQKIQISRQTKDELLKYGNVYIISSRGQIDIYGYGSVGTYFLDGYRPGLKIQGMQSRIHKGKQRI